MVDVINFYMDDSGTRHPSKIDSYTHGDRHFALGGVLIHDDDEKIARELYHEFCKNWGIDYPLHSYEIRNKKKNFSWLEDASDTDFEKFMSQLTSLLVDVPVIGHACVVDRAGHRKRFEELYNEDQWCLTRTTFNIAVERACKFAISKGCRLRVAPERCNKVEDAKLKEYYNGLKISGHPFNEGQAAQYQPLNADTFQNTLYEFKPKYKSSPMAQLADLYLWPIIQGKYAPGYRPYVKLISERKLIDAHLTEEQLPELGIKYSSF